MVVCVTTVCFQSMEVISIDAQVQVSSGLPSFVIVGLPDKAVAESRERIRAALYGMGLALPPKRITVNLAPADLQKEGSHYDLPIALGLLNALNVIPSDILGDYLALGELSLDGRLMPSSGALSSALYAASQGKGLICAAACGSEAAWSGHDNILAPSNLLELINHFKGTQVLVPPVPVIEERPPVTVDMRDVKGQESSKRALEIAAAGGHHMLMTGEPGAGKSMLAARLPGLLPPLTPQEALDVTILKSLSTHLGTKGLSQIRPFRDPHHTASTASLMGGGLKAKPGEISLAHHGVLFLDEFPEFSRAALESLRQPLETGTITIARANAHLTYPAKFQLIAAMNPCRCGFLDDPERGCRRAPLCGQEYKARLSGPLLDRIDLHIHVPNVLPHRLRQLPSGESTDVIRARVSEARERQKQRFEKWGVSHIRLNAEANGEILSRMCVLDHETDLLLTHAAEKWKLSARGYHRVLKVARTLADMEASQDLRKRHVAEALSYRHVKTFIPGEGVKRVAC